MTTRKWVVVPRGKVDVGRALAKANRIGEIEERDGGFEPYIASEEIAEAELGAEIG